MICTVPPSRPDTLTLTSLKPSSSITGSARSAITRSVPVSRANLRSSAAGLDIARGHTPQGAEEGRTTKRSGRQAHSRSKPIMSSQLIYELLPRFEAPLGGPQRPYGAPMTCFLDALEIIDALIGERAET